MTAHATPPPADKARLLAELKERVRRIEGIGGQDGTAVVPLGVAGLDAALPGGGLPLGAVHEVVAPDARLDSGAATAFAALVLARLAGGRGPVLWATKSRDLYAPGLAAFGLMPDDLILVQAEEGRRGDTDILWAMEEALRCPQVGAVLGEVGALDLSASRRLQLAAESSGVPGVLLRLGPRRVEASAAVTRWRIAARPGPPPGTADGLDAAASGPGFDAAWRAELDRCRGGRPGRWDLVWRGLAAGLEGRPAAAEPGAPLQRAGQGLGPQGVVQRGVVGG